MRLGEMRLVAAFFERGLADAQRRAISNTFSATAFTERGYKGSPQPRIGSCASAATMKR